MKNISIVLILTFSTFYANAQTLYWSRDIKKAYKNQTRSNDGWPGIKYWQNTGTYNIKNNSRKPS